MLAAEPDHQCDHWCLQGGGDAWQQPVGGIKCGDHLGVDQSLVDYYEG